MLFSTRMRDLKPLQPPTLLDRIIPLHIRLRREIKRLEKKYIEAKKHTVEDDELARLTDNFAGEHGLLAEQWLEAETKRIRRWGKRWGIYMLVPAYNTEKDLPEGWSLTPTFGAPVMTAAKRHEVRSAIFQRKILWLGVLFGISSVVQTGCAIVAYWWPRR